MSCRQRQVALLAVLIAVAAAQEVFLARRDAPAQEKVLTSTVRVKNNASAVVKLMDCTENSSPITVAAGGTTTLTLSGSNGKWVVPEGATLDCKSGDIAFFYLATDDTKYIRTYVGFGYGEDEEGETQQEGTAAGAGVALASESASVEDVSFRDENLAPVNLHGIAGVELTAGTESMACVEGICDAGYPLEAGTAGSDLVIKGRTDLRTPTYMSLWRHGGHHGHGWYDGGHHGGHHGGYHGGHHGDHHGHAWPHGGHHGGHHGGYYGGHHGGHHGGGHHHGGHWR